MRPRSPQVGEARRRRSRGRCPAPPPTRPCRPRSGRSPPGRRTRGSRAPRRRRPCRSPGRGRARPCSTSMPSIRSHAATQLRERAGPHDGRAADEQDVAGEDRPGVGHVGEHVAAGVGRADLDQLDRATADVEVEAAVEGARRAGVSSMPSKSNSPKNAAEQVADLARGALSRPASSAGGTSLISCAAAAGGDDLGAVEQLVAVAVVAVGVGVDDRRRSARSGERPPSRRACAAVRSQVEQGVDQQRRAVADDQAGVAPSPAAVGLQVGVAPVGRPRAGRARRTRHAPRRIDHPRPRATAYDAAPCAS